jgi:hypothetical protein
VICVTNKLPDDRKGVGVHRLERDRLERRIQRQELNNDVVIREVASITSLSRRVETMAASLRPTGTTLVPG